MVEEMPITPKQLEDLAKVKYKAMIAQKDARIKRTEAVARLYTEYEFEKGTLAKAKEDIIKDESREERDALYQADADLVLAQDLYDIWYEAYIKQEESE